MSAACRASECMKLRAPGTAGRSGQTQRAPGASVLCMLASLGREASAQDLRWPENRSAP